MFVQRGDANNQPPKFIQCKCIEKNIGGSEERQEMNRWASTCEM